MNRMSATQDAPLLERLDSLVFKLETLLNLVAAAAIFGLMCLGVTQVLGRKFFDFPVPGYIDVAEQSIAIFAFLGIAYCQKLGGHIRMELILGRLRGRPLWVCEALSVLAAMLLIAVLIYYGWGHFLRAYQIGDTTIDAELPVWPSKLLVPIAFTLLELRLALQLWRFIRLIADPDKEPVAVPLIARLEEQARKEIEGALGHEARGEPLARSENSAPGAPGRA